MKLQHEKAEQAASQVTAQYDGRTTNLELDENGTVEVENKAQAEALLENHPHFFKVNDEDEADHVLKGKTVDEVEEYVSEIEDVGRLKELRELENRKTGKEVIDDRISEIKQTEKEEEENGVNQDEVSEQSEKEDGAQTEE